VLFVDLCGTLGQQRVDVLLDIYEAWLRKVKVLADRTYGTKGLVVEIVTGFLKGVAETVVTVFAPSINGDILVGVVKRISHLTLRQSKERHACMHNAGNDELDS